MGTCGNQPPQNRFVEAILKHTQNLLFIEKKVRKFVNTPVNPVLLYKKAFQWGLYTVDSEMFARI